MSSDLDCRLVARLDKAIDVILRKTKFIPTGIHLEKVEGELEELINEIISHVGNRELSFELRASVSLRFVIGLDEESQQYTISFHNEFSSNAHIDKRQKFSLIEASNIAKKFFQNPLSLDEEYECYYIPELPGGNTNEIPDEDLEHLYENLGLRKKPWWKFW